MKLKQLTVGKKPFKKFGKKIKSQTIEEKIRGFVIRNSKNGYFTKVSTLSNKFGVSETRIWEIVGDLLDEGFVESVHDEKSGEMKLCENGQTYHILDLDLQRKKDWVKNKKRQKNENKHV